MLENRISDVGQFCLVSIGAQWMSSNIETGLLFINESAAGFRRQWNADRSLGCNLMAAFGVRKVFI